MSAAMTLSSPWTLGQRVDQFAADLAVGADDEDAFHVMVCARASDAELAAGLRERRDRTLQMLAVVCAADICTRMRAWPIGTTG